MERHIFFSCNETPKGGEVWGGSDALFQSLLKYSVVKFSTCRKFSGMDFLLVTIPPIGFMRSTAAVNTAGMNKERRDAKR